ncbi:MAG: NUDIX hydrolase [Nitrososphaerota archaeon]|nr:NUDIX hydrolase [Nitrososphaerota archaeon]
MSKRVLRSRRVYEGRVVNFRVDNLEIRGFEVTREVVEHRGAVAAVALTHDGYIILVKQYRHAVERPLLELPAGTLEAGESPDECLMREVREETGYSVESFRRICSIYLAPGYSNEILHLYLARVKESGGLDLEADEELEVVRLPFQEAVGMVLRGEIVDAKSIAGILMAHVSLGAH